MQPYETPAHHMWRLYGLTPRSSGGSLRSTPPRDVIFEVPRTILGIDDRVGEWMQWQSPTFTFQGNISSIDPAPGGV